MTDSPLMLKDKLIHRNNFENARTELHSFLETLHYRTNREEFVSDAVEKFRQLYENYENMCVRVLGL